MNAVTNLAGWTLASWILLAFPAKWIWGGNVFFLSIVAALICLVPTSLTLLWGQWAARRKGSQQIVVVLGGTGLRLFGVGVTVVILTVGVPAFHSQAFLIWILVFYLITLALEMIFLVRVKSESRSV